MECATFILARGFENLKIAEFQFWWEIRSWDPTNLDVIGKRIVENEDVFGNRERKVCEG